MKAKKTGEGTSENPYVYAGVNGIALGNNATVKADNAVAIGYSNEASGISALATGYDTTASGNYSTTMGYITEAAGENSVAMGYKSSAYGKNSFAFGEQAQAGNTTGGATPIYSGDNAIAMGSGANALAKNSVAIGYGAFTNTENMIALGNSDATVKVDGTLKATKTNGTGENKTTTTTTMTDTGISMTKQVGSEEATTLFNVDGSGNTTIAGKLYVAGKEVSIADTYLGTTAADANAYINTNSTKLATIADTANVITDVIDAKETNLSAQFGYDVTVDPTSDETGSVKNSLTSHDTSLVAGINTAYAEALKRTVTNDLTAGTSTITDGTNSTTVYTTTAIDEKLQAARDEITAVYDNSHKWAEDLLGVDADVDVKTQLQTALGNSNIEAKTIAGALKELDDEKAKLTGGNAFTGDQVVDGTISSKKVVESGTTTTTTETAITDSSIAMTKLVYISTGSDGYGTMSTLFNVDSSGNTTIAGNLAVGSGSATGTHSVALGSSAPNTSTYTYTGASGDYSTTMGYGTNASGVASTAMGFKTTASEYGSTAMGYKTTASGTDSTAMGAFTTASGDVSTAMGQDTTASGYVSTAMGNGSTALGEGAMATGYYTTASGEYSTTMGGYTTASGDLATAMGLLTIASGEAAISVGAYSIAQGDGSFAGGYGTGDGTLGTVQGGIAYGQSSFAFGTGAVAGKIVSGSGTTQDPYVYGGDNTVAMGANSIASGENALAMMGSTASGLNAIAIGSGNTVSGMNSVALGTGSTVSGATSYSIGNNNTIQGDNVFALGNNVNAGADITNAVVLGNNSTAVNGAVSVGSVDNYRRISNVADGVSAHDVATVGQMNASLASLEDRTNHKIDKLEDKTEKGFAATAALASLKPLSNAHKTQISAAMGGYGSNQALAIGGFHYLNDNTLINIGGAYGGDSYISYGVGLTFGF